MGPFVEPKLLQIAGKQSGNLTLSGNTNDTGAKCVNPSKRNVTAHCSLTATLLLLTWCNTEKQVRTEVMRRQGMASSGKKCVACTGHRVALVCLVMLCILLVIKLGICQLNILWAWRLEFLVDVGAGNYIQVLWKSSKYLNDSAISLASKTVCSPVRGVPSICKAGWTTSLLQRGCCWISTTCCWYHTTVKMFSWDLVSH